MLRMKHRKLKITLLSLMLAGTVLAMITDQAVGSCCGSRESASIEIWWWLALATEIALLVYVISKKPN